jgi:alanine dehydrogenase
MLVCSEDDVAAVLAYNALLDVVADAFRAQADGRVERPRRPHFPVGQGRDGADPLGTALAMPAYVHGAPYYATKLASVFPGNESRELPTVQAQLSLLDAETGSPVAYLAATRLTNARTGCVAGLAARELASGPVRLGLLGAGAVARASARAIAAATDLESVRVYSPSDSREDCAADLAGVAPDVSAVASPVATVGAANVVVTATTSETPVFDGGVLEAGTLVVALGAYTPEMQEIDVRTVERAARVFGDVPGEVAETGDLRAVGVDADAVKPFADVVTGEAGRSAPDDVLLVESVGSAVLDAAAGAHLYERAVGAGVGREVDR